MTTLELARKLDQCLQAQVKLQKERDEAVEALQLYVLSCGRTGAVIDHPTLYTAYDKARAVLARIDREVQS